MRCTNATLQEFQCPETRCEKYVTEGDAWVIALFVAVILVSILVEFLFWTYAHGWLLEQLVLVSGIMGLLVLTSALLFIPLKLYGSNHRAYEILWGTAFAIAVIAVMATLFTLVEILLH
jgi:hypothetical protein